MPEKRRSLVQVNTVILHTAALLLLPLQILFSVFLLLRGHAEPGGGFIAGLVATGAVALYLFAPAVESTPRTVRLEPQELWGLGLPVSVTSALIGPLMGEPFFTAQWYTLYLGGNTEVKLSTVLLFDVGVYFTVLGALLMVVISLTEAED